jgi:glutamyl-tRNA(Gln) amidotransferase subunit D
MFSENMTSENWKRLAAEAAAELESGLSGVVIPHGTDTLGYTAAALSFMLDDLTGPVILVGSQRSSDRPSSDAFLNLTSSVSTFLPSSSFLMS